MENTWEAPQSVSEMSVSSLPIGNRALNVMRKYGIKTVENLVGYEANDLTDMRGFGPTCLQETIEALAELGLKLKSPDYPARR